MTTSDPGSWPTAEDVDEEPAVDMVTFEARHQWRKLHLAFELWTVEAVAVWATDLDARWRAFMFRHQIDGARLMTITPFELECCSECPDHERLWKHIVDWRYVITVPAALLVEKCIGRKATGRPPGPHMELDWSAAQYLLAYGDGSF